MEPAGVAQLPTLLANGCSCVVSLLPTATCTRVGGRRRRKQQRRWRERRQRRRQLTMSALPGPRCLAGRWPEPEGHPHGQPTQVTSRSAHMDTGRQAQAGARTFRRTVVESR